MEGNEKVTNDNWAGGVQVEDIPDKNDPYKEVLLSDDLKDYKDMIYWNRPNTLKIKTC